MMAPIYAKVVGDQVTILPTNVGANVEVTPNLAFGYALTDHKAQGSTYKTAFVDEDNMSIVTRTIKDRDGSFYSYEANNMKYVGFSRPSTNLHIFTKKPIIHEEREKLDYSDSPTKIIYDILKKTKLNTFSVTQETGMKVNQEINAFWVKNSSSITIQTLAGDIASQYPYMNEQDIRDIIIEMIQHTPTQYEKKMFGAIPETQIDNPELSRIFAFNPPPYDGLPEENFRCDD
jgi:uncharacterized protein with WD repeat